MAKSKFLRDSGICAEQESNYLKRNTFGILSLGLAQRSENYFKQIF